MYMCHVDVLYLTDGDFILTLEQIFLQSPNLSHLFFRGHGHGGSISLSQSAKLNFY